MKRRAYPTLKAWRDAQEFSQRQAAKELGITQAYYCQLENGKQAPRPTIAKKVADKTSVPLEVLLGIAS